MKIKPEKHYQPLKIKTKTQIINNKSKKPELSGVEFSVEQFTIVREMMSTSFVLGVGIMGLLWIIFG